MLFHVEQHHRQFQSSQARVIENHRLLMDLGQKSTAILSEVRENQAIFIKILNDPTFLSKYTNRTINLNTDN